MESSTVARLVQKLDQDPALNSKDLYKVLVTIRTKHMNQEEILLKEGAVGKLVHHLKRPNSKIVDVVLSILGNLFLNEEARKQIKPHLRILSSILTTLNEESILARTCRCLANVAQDPENAKILKMYDLLLVLVKTLNELKSTKAKTPVIRAIRIIASICSTSLMSNDEELLKTVTKCLAKFTNHGCDNFVALQIQGEGQGFQRLVECCKLENRSIWEPALATLVNLSFIESLRPNLGNAGVIWTLIVKANLTGPEEALGPQDFFRTVSALCLYCHESVNRMKIRDAGGLRLFVAILQDDINTSNKVVKDKIIKSLMQFSYDALSLKVLQHAGLVPALVMLIEKHNSRNYYKHSCEEFICDMNQKLSDDEDVGDHPGDKDNDELRDTIATADNAKENTSDQADTSGSNEGSEAAIDENIGPSQNDEVAEK